MLKLCAILLTLCAFNGYAFENEFFLRLGASLGYGVAHSDNTKYDNQVYTAGISTQFGYVFKKYELGFTTHIQAGSIDDYYLAEAGQTLEGSGSILMESYTLYLKRITEIYPIKFWRLYYSFGITAGFNTIKLRTFKSSSPLFTHNHKIAMDSAGLTFSFGIEENALRKSSKPNYIQFSYSGLRPVTLSIIDATDYTKVESLYQSAQGKSMIVHTFLLEAGVLVF